MTRRAWLLLGALTAAVPAHDAAGQTSFFDSHDVIEATLRADLGTLRSDRDTATARWHDATLTWRGPDGPRTVPLRVRTRGIYRLANCLFPPIRLRFAESDVRGTPWEGLRRLKLVTHCVDRAAYEQNLLQEYAIYRVLRLLTPLSYSVRLVRMTYEDSGGPGAGAGALRVPAGHDRRALPLDPRPRGAGSGAGAALLRRVLPRHPGPSGLHAGRGGAGLLAVAVRRSAAGIVAIERGAGRI